MQVLHSRCYCTIILVQQYVGSIPHTHIIDTLRSLVHELPGVRRIDVSEDAYQVLEVSCNCRCTPQQKNAATMHSTFLCYAQNTKTWACAALHKVTYICQLSDKYQGNNGRQRAAFELQCAKHFEQRLLEVGGGQLKRTDDDGACERVNSTHGRTQAFSGLFGQSDDFPAANFKKTPQNKNTAVPRSSSRPLSSTQHLAQPSSRLPGSDDTHHRR